MTSIRCVLSALLAVALASPASADKLSPEADAKFASGSKAFEAKNYEAALEEFYLGYLLDPNPDFLYAIGQAYRAAGACAKAKAAYDAFKRSKPPKKKAAKADANMARCQEAPPKPIAKAPDPPATPVANTTPPTTSTEEAPNEPKAPSTTEPKDGGSGGTTRVVISAQPSVGPWYTDWLGDSLAVGGFVALGVGAFLWVGGRGDLEEANTPGRYSDYASFTRDVESASRKQTIGVVTFAAGGALATAAVLRWWLRPGARPPVEATAGKDGGMVFYTTSF